MSTTQIHASDLTFLNMDRPTNLMVVNGLTWFAEEPDWDAVRDVLQQRLIDRFPVLHRRPARVGRTWVWEDDPDFDLDRHIRHVTLGGSGDLAAAQTYVSHRVSQPLDRAHPLWEIDILGGLAGKGGQPKAIILSRFHHSLADGIRLVQLVLSLFDAAPGATPPTVGRVQSAEGRVTKAVGISRRLAGEVVDYAEGVGSAAAAAMASAPKQLVNAPKRVVSLGRDAFEEGFDFRVSPTRLTDAVTGLSSDDNQLVNSWRSASRLALAGTRPDLTGDGAPGVDKRVSWVTGIDVSAVKVIGAEHDATVNDVLLAVVSRGLSRYVEEKGRRLVDEVNWLVPISLKPIDMNLPTELGNAFAMVLFPMPLGIKDDDALMQEISSRMTRTKNSAEAMMVFGLQRVVAEAPAAVGVGVTEFVANKTVGVLTNVPGPRAPMYLAGAEVTGMLGWVPTAADQSLGICIFSYNGEVSIGISSDARLMPDPEHLAELMRQEFAALAG